jgi:hypothetical protein
MNSFMRIALKDLTAKARTNASITVFDDHDIIVKLFGENKVLIGKQRIEAALLRQI